MRLTDDAELYAVSNTWLGPKGQQLPWRARYSAYGVGFCIFLATLAIERRLGVSVGLMSMVLALLATIIATRYVMRAVTFERPVRTIVVTFWHELNAPRRIIRGTHGRFTLRRISVWPRNGRGRT